jgi:hypothetical protein
MTFRAWLQEMWFQHKDEMESYCQGLPYSSKEYFVRYKYWLKREYRHQQGVK